MNQNQGLQRAALPIQTKPLPTPAAKAKSIIKLNEIDFLKQIIM